MDDYQIKTTMGPHGPIPHVPDIFAPMVGKLWISGTSGRMPHLAEIKNWRAFCFGVLPMPPPFFRWRAADTSSSLCRQRYRCRDRSHSLPANAGSTGSMRKHTLADGNGPKWNRLSESARVATGKATLRWTSCRAITPVRSIPCFAKAPVAPSASTVGTRLVPLRLTLLAEILPLKFYTKKFLALGETMRYP